MSETYKGFTLNSANDTPWEPTENALFKAIIDRLANVNGGVLNFLSTNDSTVKQTLKTFSNITAEYGYIDVLSYDTGVAGDYEYSRTAFINCVASAMLTPGTSQIFKIAASGNGAKHTISATTNTIQIACSNAGTSGRNIIYGFFDIMSTLS